MATNSLAGFLVPRSNGIAGLSCNPTQSPLYKFNYCPSLPAAILFTVLFGLSILGHTFQAWHYGKRFCWVLIMGGLWEFISIVTRVASIESPFNASVSQVTFVFLVLAPLWINAFDYVVLGRMVYYYLPDKKLAGVKAQRISLYFVTMDISSFVIQLVGAVTTVGSNTNPSATVTGLHIYTAGVCLQQAVIAGFAILLFVFHRRMKRESTRNITQGNRLVLTMLISIALITYRIIFRIIEFSAGNQSPIRITLDDNEWFMYVFDEMPMFLVLVVFHIYHPGYALVGPESNYPTLTKEEKAIAKEQKKKRKMERKRAKKDGSVSLADLEGSTDTAEENLVR